MPDNILDVFNDDAFSAVTLTDALANIDHVPGRAGELAFVGVGTGVPTTDVAIEYKDTALSIVPTTPRGAPAPKETRDKAKLFKLKVPHVQVEDVINSESVQNIRAFGSGDLIAGAQSVINEQMVKMAQRLDLTLEHMRLGALKGRVLDADDTVIVDLYDAFGVAEPDVVMFPSGAGSAGGSFRATCQQVSRQIQKAAKMLLPGTAKIYGLCGDDFFDELVSLPDVTNAFQGWSAAQDRLAGNAVATGFPFGGIVFENYRGTDGVTGEEASDGELTGEVGIASGECRLFMVGVPGLYVEKYAPADFMTDVNVVGLPRYAKQWPTDNSGRSITVHLQENPLPLCTRPATLVAAKFA